jgi:hypothetical protein
MFKRAAVVTLIILGLTAFTWGQTGEAASSSGEIAAKALSFFEQIEGRDFDAYLKRARPPQVSASVKAQVLANLVGGEVIKPTPRMQAKLAALMPILKYHARESVIEIKVLDLPRASVGIQGHSALLISEQALRLLTTDELQAIVAHEMAHEYFWAEYWEAHRRQRYEALREIELRCDGIAVITLERMGLDPANLISGIQKIQLINTRVEEMGKLTHPLPAERLKFIRAMAELVKVRSEAERAASRQ